MPIQTVNGRNVYVISAEVPTARTSNGQGYATLVTSLRWQLWEEAQKAVLQEMKFSEATYETKMKIYAEQQKYLQNKIDDYDLLITKAKAGQPIDRLHRERKLQDEQDKREEQAKKDQFRADLAAAPSSTTTTTTVDRSTVGNVAVTPPGTEGKTKNGETSTETTAPPPASANSSGNLAAPGNRPPVTSTGEQRSNTASDMGIKEPTGVQDKYVVPPAGPTRSDTAGSTTTSTTRSKAKVKAPEATAAETPEEEAKRIEEEQALYEQQLKVLTDEKTKLENELKGLGVMPEAPSYGDLIQRSREKYAQSYGTHGGFGMAERPTKVTPYFNEEKAAKDASALAEYGANMALATERKKRAETTGVTEDKIVFSPEEEMALRREGALHALTTTGGREVSAPDFLSRGRDRELSMSTSIVAPGRLGPLSGDVEAQEGTTPTAETGNIVPPGSTPEDYTAASGMGRGSEVVDYKNKADWVAPALKPNPRGYPSGAGFAPEIAGPPRFTPRANVINVPSGGGFAPEIPGPPKRTPIVNIPPNPNASVRDIQNYGQRLPVVPVLPKEAQKLVHRMNAVDYGFMNDIYGLDLKGKKGKGSHPALQNFNPPSSETPGVSPSDLREREMAPPPVVQPIPNPESPIGGPPKEKPTALRRDQYKVDILAAATKLASQKSKMERLAKPDLSPEERKGKVPEYVILVDNLYDTNKRAGTDPVGASYSELNRVYANDPKTRAAAQEYLLAKNILETEISNPVS